jgi:polysaccharide pyruvyl transferase WcaK-like protein
VSPDPRELRVCLIFHSTVSDNLGVGALTVSEIEILRRIAADQGRRLAVTVIDWADPRAPYVTGPDIRVLKVGGKFLINPRGFFAEARRAHIVIDIGAGDSFADIYGPKRLARMLLMKFATHLARRPLVVAPQTVGPFKKPLSRWLARLTLNLSAIVATRDRLSTACVREELGVTRAVIEASDVALRLPYTAPPARPAGGVPRVGINVSGLLMAGGYTRSNMFGLTLDYPALMDRLIAAFRALPGGCEVHLVPHVIVRAAGSPEDDYSASEALAARHPGVIVAPAFASPSEAKTYIAGLDFFMGARMHSCIAAFSSGVPVIPMAYSRKFAGLFGSLGYDQTVDCTAESADAILDRIMAAYAGRDALAQDVGRALALGREKLARYETALAALCAAR